RGDGSFAVLEGNPGGLSLSDVTQATGLPSPSALAFVSARDGTLEVYAVSQGEEAATLLSFALGAASPPPLSGGGGGSGVTTPSAAGQGLTLLPSRDSSLPLLAALLTSTVELESEG